MKHEQFSPLGHWLRSDAAGYVGAALIIVGSCVLQVVAATLWPSIVWPDQIFQTVEQAHRLVFDYGTVPWEFKPHYGLRNWMFPALLALPAQLSKLVDPLATHYIILTRLMMSLISLAPNWILVKILRRESSNWLHIFTALFAFNFWFEFIYYGPKPLFDVIGTSCLLMGLGYAHLSLGEISAPNTRRAALFLTLAALFRVQLAPAAAVIYGIVYWQVVTGQLRRQMLVTALIPTALFGLADWIAWGVPFYSFLQYVRLNLGQDIASSFGIAPWHAYMGYYWQCWGAALVLLMPLLVYKARGKFVFLVAGAITFIAMSSIGHKEIRFIYPVSMIMLMVIAINFVRYFRDHAISRVWVAAYVASFAIFSLYQAAKFPPWQHKTHFVRMFEYLRAQDDLCGIVLHDNVVVDYPGYYYLHRNVPVVSLKPERFAPEGSEPLGKMADGNYHVSMENLEATEAVLRTKCFGSSCVYRSAGGCKSGE